MAKILVTGATGTVGSATVKALLARGADVRVGVRSPDKAGEYKQAGAEVVAFDFDDVATYKGAFTGAERVLLLNPFVDSVPAQVRSAVAVARETGVKYILRISAFGADVSSPLFVGRMHGEADKLVAESGISYTIVQPTFFQDNLLKFHLGSLRSQNAFYGASGGGKTSYISSGDIAKVSAAILLDPARHASKTYVLTGPEALSDEEVAALVGKVTGRAIKFVNLTPEQLAGGMQGAPAWMVESLVGLENVKAQGWAAAVSPAVQDILGHPGERYESFLARHRDEL